MSEFENTNLPFLEKDCIEFFGKEQGKKIFGKTLEIYRELTRKADYRNNETIKYHNQVKIKRTRSEVGISPHLRR